jgi:hypothetical protein
MYSVGSSKESENEELREEELADLCLKPKQLFPDMLYGKDVMIS